LKSNYSFCVEWVRRQSGNLRVLDYGCGGGEIVLSLRRHGVESYGCDVFYEGGDRSGLVAPGLYEEGVIRRMEPEAIPFDDESFDIVISNQVLEHVTSIEVSLAEIARVLKPGGKVLSLFPHRGAWFEWHVGIPFIHWFPAGSRARLRYAMIMRMLGFGFFKAGKSISAWSRHSVDYVDRWTHYRTRADIDNAFARHFINLSRLEAEWLSYKVGDSLMVRMLPASWRQFITTTLAGLVFECEKPDVAVRV
jgi:SAM-dependent methyltransferase